MIRARSVKNRAARSSLLGLIAGRAGWNAGSHIDESSVADVSRNCNCASRR